MPAAPIAEGVAGSQGAMFFEKVPSGRVIQSSGEGTAMISEIIEATT